MARLRSWADRQVEVMLADYFPRPLSILDRDVSLGVVQATLDYGQQFGLTRPDAADVLVLDDRGAVSVHARSPWLTARSVYRLPIGVLTTVTGMRHRPSAWIRTQLQPMLSEIATLLETDLSAASDAELLTMIKHGVEMRVAMFSSRRRHFLPSFTLKIVADQVARLIPRLTRGVGLHGDDNPTAVFRRDLHRLTAVWRRVAEGSADAGALDTAMTSFMAVHGGRGHTFVPLVSDEVWDTHPDDLLSVLPALSASQSDAATTTDASPGARRSRAIARRLSEISAERDWMAFGYEQATRLIRNPVRVLGARWAGAGLLADADDIVHLHLAEIEDIVADHEPVDQDLVAARRRAFSQPRPAPMAPSGDAELRGVGAAPGTFTGIARVVTSPADFATLQPGEILVCQMTSPAWMPLLMVAGAVVSDLGGILSHAAIVAREFGIPAVTGTGDATSRLISGSAYVVDGDAGVVRPYAAADSPA